MTIIRCGFEVARMLTLAVFIPCVGACALAIPETYTSPKEITLPVALASVACGLKSYENELQRLNLNNGTILDQVDVTLNLKASATGKSDLAIDVKPNVAQFGTLGFNYTDSLTKVGDRENQIKLTFKSLYTVTPNKAGEVAFKKAKLALKDRSIPEIPVKEPCRDRSYEVTDNSRSPKTIPE